MNNHIILFDFEYTAWEGSKARNWSEPWEHREIIQIAAIRVAVENGVSEIESFDCLVHPKKNPRLSAYITALTGIEQAVLDARGRTFPEAFAGFYAFCEQGQIPIYCYGDDLSVLVENCAIHDMPLASFPAGMFDIRAIFEQAGVNTQPHTSGTIYQAVGAEFSQPAHNALNDVRSLAVTIRQLTRDGRLGPHWLGGKNNTRGRFPIT